MVASWLEVGEYNLKAAKLLLDEGFYRSAASRAYYAAYASMTGVFVVMNVRFAYGNHNPSHSQLLALTANNLDPTRFSQATRRQLKRATTALQATRINADYSPRTTIDKNLALQMVRLAGYVVTVTAKQN